MSCGGIMKFRMVRLAVVCVVAVSILCSHSRAQTTSAMVTGEVTDQSGRLVPDAAVVFTNINTGSPYATRTNKDGVFSLPGLQPGVYRANIAKDGFKSIVKPDIELHTQDQVSLNFSLQVGSISETVTVSGGISEAETTNPAVSMTVTREFVEDMPLNGRSFQDLIQLAPGAVSSGLTGYYSIDGQRTDSNNFTVD